MDRKPYPTDVSDGEWEFLAPYLTLMVLDAPQRKHDLREVFNALRYIVRAGCSWRLLPTNFPDWEVVYQQTQRWLAAGVFEDIVHDLRAILRLASGRNEEPSASIVDSRTLISSVESGSRAGYDGAKKRRGSKVHMAVDTLGNLLALHVTPANEGDRSQVEQLCSEMQEATGESIEVVYADQGYTGEKAIHAAQNQGVELVVVKLPEAKKGFVLLPKRWVVERSFGWMTRFRRLVKDYERLPGTVEGLHFLAFACLMLTNFFKLINST